MMSVALTMASRSFLLVKTRRSFAAEMKSENKHKAYAMAFLSAKASCYSETYGSKKYAGWRRF